MKRSPILLAAVLAVVLAACGADQPSPTATEAEVTPTVEPTPETTPTPTEEPATPTPTDAPGSGFTGSLADALPDEVGGLPRQDIPGIEAMIASALAQSGMDVEEADFAWAMWGEGDLIVTAFRMPGLDRPQLELLARMISGGQAGGADVEAETVTIGGKSVLRMGGADMPEAAYLYFAGDAFFTVVSESADLAGELLAQLP